VAEGWGFGRLASGGGGLKAFFTGDPGTGKTLAAEVVAALLGMPLLKLNSAQILSKWVGETEKNLDEAFAEAETSHAVLFVDEADALCGRRGEVRHGTDRYANTEVSHLLQRLEDHDGLVILASNLKDNIDPAFVRRFQVILHFPRPSEEDRLRLWRLAFPAEAPLRPDVDLGALARLDMTGAGIVGAARTSALMAADLGLEAIGMAQVVKGVARQYRRDGRVLAPREFGPYAAFLQEPT
jgi:SpoVK/Ycf46/Vps4 family AAA+-type ATPase